MCVCSKQSCSHDGHTTLTSSSGTIPLAPAASVGQCSQPHGPPLNVQDGESLMSNHVSRSLQPWATTACGGHSGVCACVCIPLSQAGLDLVWQWSDSCSELVVVDVGTMEC